MQSITWLGLVRKYPFFFKTPTGKKCYDLKLVWINLAKPVEYQLKKRVDAAHNFSKAKTEAFFSLLGQRSKGFFAYPPKTGTPFRICARNEVYIDYSA
jgi:hypothetical protein